jgi:hypothetical protein
MRLSHRMFADSSMFKTRCDLDGSGVGGLNAELAYNSPPLFAQKKRAFLLLLRPLREESPI